MKEFFGEDYLCTGISLIKKTEKHGIQIRKNYEKSCYLSRRKYDLGKRNRIQKRRRLFENAPLRIKLYGSKTERKKRENRKTEIQNG